MELFLSQRIDSYTGMLIKDTGYAVRKQYGRFFSYRCANIVVPPNGHLRFIIQCARMAQQRLYIEDIRLTGKEFLEAVEEADMMVPLALNPEYTLHHREVLWLNNLYIYGG